MPLGWVSIVNESLPLVTESAFTGGRTTDRAKGPLMITDHRPLDSLQLTRRGALRAGAVAAATFWLVPHAAQGATALTEAATPESFAQARRQWLAALIGQDLDRTHPAVKAQLTAVANNARTTMVGYQWGAGRTGLWPDLSLAARVTIADSERVTQTIRRLRTIATAWAADALGTGADAAFAMVVDGLDWLSRDVYSTTGVRYGNWYVWDVSAPQAFNDTLLLTYPALDPALRSRLLAAEAHLSPEIPQDGTRGTAANRVLICDSFTGRGILAEDEAVIVAARDGLAPVLVYAQPFGGPVGLVDGNTNEPAFFSNDGFYPDGSFIQHGQFAYVGGYGASYLTSITAIAARTRATPWQADISIVPTWMKASFEPWLRRGLVMDTVRGRGLATVDGDRGTGLGFIAGMINLSLATDGETRNHLRSVVKAELTARGAGYSGLALPQLAVALDIMTDASQAPRPELTGTFVFGAMDRVLHRRPGWATAFAMHSLRMADYETGDKENLRGWYTADAATYLYTDDLFQYDDGYWCTVDSQRLPGTTIDTVPREAKPVPWRGEYHNPSFWAGGVTAGEWGAAGLDLTAKAPSTLRARQSRFFFADRYVCIGSGITVAEGRRAETVLENRRVTAVSKGTLIVDGIAAAGLGATSQHPAATWAHLEGVAGYVLAHPADLRVVHEERTGKLSDISGTVTGTTASTVRRGEYVTVVAEHPAGTESSSYAYSVLPGATAEATAAEAATPTVQVLAQGRRVHAVREVSTGRFAATFFEAATAAHVTADGPCAVAIEEADGELRLWLSDPTQMATTVRVTLTERVRAVASADPRLQVELAGGRVVVTADVAGLRGESLAATLTR